MKNLSIRNYAFAMGIALAAATMFTACDDDDDDVPVSKVPVEVRDSFRAMYEGVRNAFWETESQYYVAAFTYNGFTTEAWYVADGTWKMTETDYGMQTSYLPMAVQNSFGQSQYASYTVDDVSLYEKPISSFCVIELDTPNGQEVSLFYDTNGNLLNTLSGDDIDITPDTNPSTVVI